MQLQNNQPPQQFEATPPLQSAEHPNVARLRAELDASLQDSGFRSLHYELRMIALKCGRRELDLLQ